MRLVRMIGNLARLTRFVRLPDWWSQKIPPLLAAIYISIPLLGIDVLSSLKIASIYLVMVFFVASYGHLFNDVFDVEADTRAGKKNVMRGVGWGQRALMCLALVTGGFLSLLGLPAPRWAALCLGLNYLWPTVYSAPGIRLKERGALGLICDAAGSHITPTLLAFVVVSSITHHAVHTSLVAAFVAWASVLGVKGIIYHQAADRESDLVSGQRTFATALPVERLTTVFSRYNLFVELPVSAVLVTVCLPRCPIGAAALCCYLALETAKCWMGFQFALNADPRLHRRSVPFANEFFYTVWFPTAASIQLGLTGAAWVWVPLLHLASFRAQAAIQWADAASVIRHLGPKIRDAWRRQTGS